MIISPETLLLGLQIVLIMIGVLIAAYVGEWLINRDDARRQHPRPTTTSKAKPRDIDKLWRGAWRDTMPPVQQPRSDEARR